MCEIFLYYLWAVKVTLGYIYRTDVIMSSLNKIRDDFLLHFFRSAHTSSNIVAVPLSGENEFTLRILSGFKARNVIFSWYGFELFAIIWNADLRYIYFSSLSWWPMSNKSSHLI